MGSVCSVCSRLDGPAAVVQFVLGFCGSNRGWSIALGANASLGTDYTPAGLTPGFWLSVLASGLVWVEVEVWTSLGRPAVPVCVSKSPPCFARTTRVFAFSLRLDFCWAYRTQLTSVIVDCLYLVFPPPITVLGPGMVRVEGIWYPWGGPPLIFFLSIKPLT